MQRFKSLLFCCLMALSYGSLASQAQELPSDLALVPANAVGFLHVRIAEVWKHESMKDYRAIFLKAGPRALSTLDDQFVPAPSTIERVTAVLMPFKTENQPNDMPVVAILHFSKPFDGMRVVKNYLKDAKELKVDSKSCYIDEEQGLAVSFPDANTLLIGDKKYLPVFLSGKKTDKGQLSDALQMAAKGSHFTVSANIQALPISKEMVEQVPPDLRALTQTQSVTMTMSIAQTAKMFVNMKYASEQDAKNAEDAIRQMTVFAKQAMIQPRREAEDRLNGKQGPGRMRPLEELPDAIGGVAIIGLLNSIEEVLDNPPMKRTGSELVMDLSMPGWSTQYFGFSAVGVGLMLPAVQKVREAAARSQMQNNLKQVALAMHNHESAYGKFPAAAITDKNGKKLLSWRVAILPYMEQDQLYREFKLDEPWDSEHNKKLIPKMPKIYIDPRQPNPTSESGETYVKVFVGGGAAFDWTKSSNIASITDGTSNTIMAVVGGQPVTWTKPDDFDFDPTKPLPDLSVPFSPILNCAFMDGSVRAIRLDMKDREKIMKLLIQKNDGTPIPIFD